AEAGPAVVVLVLAAYADHRVDQAGAAQSPSARLVAAATAQTRLRHGMPGVVARIAERHQRGDAQRHVRAYAAFRGAGLHQQHAGVGTRRRQPRRGGATGGSGADDDGVECPLGWLHSALLGAEDLVTGVAEPGQDVALLVEPLVDRGRVDLDVGVRGLDALEALRRGDQDQALDARAAGGLQHVHGGDQGTGSGQHRVDDQRDALVHAAGELLVVGDRLQRPLVALQAHHADLGGGDQVEHARQHAEARAQDRYDGDLGALDPLHDERAGPAFDAFLDGFQVLGGLVGEQGGHFAGQLAELLGADAGAAHQAQLVADQRVADFDDLHWPSIAAGKEKGAALRRRPVQAAAGSVRGGSGGGITLQAGAHEGLVLGTLRRLDLGLGIAGLHAFLLGFLGRRRGGGGRRGMFALQAGAHEGLALGALLAGRFLVAVRHALLLRGERLLGGRSFLLRGGGGGGRESGTGKRHDGADGKYTDRHGHDVTSLGDRRLPAWEVYSRGGSIVAERCGGRVSPLPAPVSAAGAGACRGEDPAPAAGTAA